MKPELTFLWTTFVLEFLTLCEIESILYWILLRGSKSQKVKWKIASTKSRIKRFEQIF